MLLRMPPGGLAILACICSAATVVAEVRLVKFSDAKQIKVGNIKVTRILHPEMSARKLAMDLLTLERANELPQHVHAVSDAVVIILKGSVDLVQGPERQKLSAGQAAVVPSGQIHGLANGSSQASALTIQTPPDMSWAPSGAAVWEPPKNVKGMITPGTVRVTPFSRSNRRFVLEPNIGIATRRLKPGEAWTVATDARGEQAFFVLKGAVRVGAKDGYFDAGELDTVLARGLVKFDIRNASAEEAAIIAVQVPPQSGPG